MRAVFKRQIVVCAVSNLQPVVRNILSGQEVSTEPSAALLHSHAHLRRLQVCRQPESTPNILPHLYGMYHIAL